MKQRSIITYNVNGVRAAIRKGLTDWILENNFDIVCLQEVKANEEDADLEQLRDHGYHIYWNSAQKKGYSGVAIFTKDAPDNILHGCGIERYDCEGRVLRADFGDTSLINTYFPSGTSGDHRQSLKYDFLRDFREYIAELRKEREKLIICGDFNIAHTKIDIHNPVSNKNSSGFLPEEREWFTTFLSDGFVDTFRHFNPDPHHYTWWSFMHNARKNNKGWRIDYFTVNEQYLPQVKNCTILPDAVHSDHCPVQLNILL